MFAFVICSTRSKASRLSAQCLAYRSIFRNGRCCSTCRLAWPSICVALANQTPALDGSVEADTTVVNGERQDLIGTRAPSVFCHVEGFLDAHAVTDLSHQNDGIGIG